jgi:uncharacterized membrane protein YfcA
VEFLFSYGPPFVIMMIAAGVQGSFGMGLGLLASPALALVDVSYVPGPLLANGLVMMIMMARRERAHIDFRGVRVALVGLVPGTALGAVALGIAPASWIGVGLGVLILLGVLMSVMGPRLEATRGTLTGAGFLAGFMGTTTGVGGPPLALVYQHAPGAAFRATMAGFFLTAVVLALISLALAGQFGPSEMRLALVLLPGLFVGYGGSGWAVSRLPNRVVRPAVLIASFTAAVAVILRHLL